MPFAATFIAPKPCAQHTYQYTHPHARRGSLWKTFAKPRSAPRRARYRASKSQNIRSETKPTAVVVGGGWAGFGAAWQLIKLGFEVQLVDASPNPGGLASGWRTSQGRAVEAGVKGFWSHYANIFSLVEELDLDSDPFTEWTASAFWSPRGLEVKAPVFQDLPRLPTPLGNFVYTAPEFTRLSLEDRLTALPLIQALLEFDLDEESFSKYDKMTARELFLRNGVSPSLYRDFLEPILLALLFVPLEQLSAATALAVLYNYVLAHQSDFDVRWCRGAIAERIFSPWRAAIEHAGGTVEGGWRVEEVQVENGVGAAIKASTAGPDGAARSVRSLEADYFVLAVGVGALQGITRGSPGLARRPEFRALGNLDKVDVLAVRLWFDRKIEVTPSASNVLAGFDEGVAGTFFDLTALHDEYASEEGSVIEVDLYNAAIFMPLGDEAILEEVHLRYLGGCIPAFRSARIVDSSVLKFPKAVTKFSPGSYAWMPDSVTSLSNLMLAGDHIKHGPSAHGARGLSQEKALVTGMIAANVCAERKGLRVPTKLRPIPVERDEIHIAAAKEIAMQARQVFNMTRVFQNGNSV
ncbi:hypothetical protein CYMTET_38379 [Cymbomonas tetramitiformis]|uniref:Amine oxidase domain-containing protein n=1 Tax=Cymbomonas tetramitiformis TaxID=36881 RepID=A0AAE0CC39_9CHLO|nr:hypothetical protein CYMTET_38379 [Cymbomonas tetramitiformis]